jgi:histidinol-phosphatase (PHP family)
VSVDSHTHLRPDGERIDATALTREHVAGHVAVAIARGIEEVSITEHVYRFAAARDLSDHPFWQESASDDLAAYHDALAAIRDGGLPVRVGLELDWIAGQERAVAALAQAHPWDVVLGSVHWLGPLAIDHPDYSIWDVRGVEAVWQEYVDAFCEAAASGLYDVLAHVDLAKVFGHRPSAAQLERHHARMVMAIVAGGSCVEVSTAGLRKAAQELYPAPSLLEALRRAYVPITLSSDAHVAEDVGRDLPLAVAAARKAGYRSVVAFRGRERRVVDL